MRPFYLGSNRNTKNRFVRIRVVTLSGRIRVSNYYVSNGTKKQTKYAVSDFN